MPIGPSPINLDPFNHIKIGHCDGETIQYTDYPSEILRVQNPTMELLRVKNPTMELLRVQFIFKESTSEKLPNMPNPMKTMT